MLLNKPRAHEALRQFGLDAIIASTPENVAYLTDFAGWFGKVYQGIEPERGIQAYGVLTKDDKSHPSLIANGTSVNYLANHRVPVHDLWTYGAPIYARPEGAEPVRADERLLADLLDRQAKNRLSPALALTDCLRSLGLTRGRVAWETFNLAPAVRAAVREALPDVQFLDTGPLFRYIRMVKSQDELERIRDAAMVNEEAIAEVVHAIRPGMSEIELRRVYKRAIGERDAEFEFFNNPSGRRAGWFFPPSDYRLKRGDTLWIDGGCIYNLYHADTGVCGFMGEPTEEARQLYRGMMNTLEAGLEILKPGVRGSELYDAMAKAQTKNNMHLVGGFGHGIGIEVRDFPILLPARPKAQPRNDAIVLEDDDIPVEPGTVVNLEVPYWQVGFGGVHVEYTMTVTDNGFEFTIPYEREQLVFAA